MAEFLKRSFTASDIGQNEILKPINDAIVKMKAWEDQWQIPAKRLKESMLLFNEEVKKPYIRELPITLICKRIVDSMETLLKLANLKNNIKDECIDELLNTIENEGYEVTTEEEDTSDKDKETESLKDMQTEPQANQFEEEREEEVETTEEEEPEETEEPQEELPDTGEEDDGESETPRTPEKDPGETPKRRLSLRRE